MKSFSFLLLVTAFSLTATTTFAQRQDILLNDNWNFRMNYQVENSSWSRVDLPHTWNAQDALSGKIDYQRNIGNYVKNIFVKPEWQGKRLFLRFEGANTVTNLFINKKHVGEHRGGYAAFIFEITDQVKYGVNNEILVRVNNSVQLDVMPLVGDFNFYGGIYRDVHLLITEKICITPLDFASPGVYFSQKNVSAANADIDAKVILSNSDNADKTVNVTVKIFDKDRLVQSQKQSVTVNKNSNKEALLQFSIKNPHLWNGRKDPFMYRVETSVEDGSLALDKVVQPLGLRFYHVDANKGFFLNGSHLPLRGVCRHQDRAEIGNALHPEHHQEDMDIMAEMGVNSIRLAHYHQSKKIYDLSDETGMVIWAEIPFVGPGGYADKGFVDLVAFKENGKLQLKELIRQNYNHPSICFWGLFNEIKEQGDNPVEFVKELNVLAHQEDPTRSTTAASNQGGGLNFISDLIAWNRYDGWYGGTPANLGKWLDDTHQRYPQLKIGISEYGAGASIYHQQDSLKQTTPVSWWHPENWQTYYHIENWRTFAQRPFVWGTYIWNMFDFGAGHRHEGDRPGINDKGLVTFNRKVKKDAFYFYKANWNSEPMIYLAEKRNTRRQNPLQNFMAFTNTGGAELFINGKSYGKKKADELNMVKWENISLEKGDNKIEVVSGGKPLLRDGCVVKY